MNIYKQLPIAFPFYEEIKAQEIYKENVNDESVYKLISPENALLPFQITLLKNKANPTKWEIINLDENVIIDITHNLNLIKIYEFEEHKQAVYFGSPLQFIYETINQPLKLPCDFYFTKITFADNSYFVSEVFRVEGNLNDFIKIDFWCKSDLEKIIFRDGFKQWVYLPTFVHTAAPEIEEEVLKDGFGNEVPVWQKLSLKHKFIDVVPDFLKTALVSLQMQDFVYLWISETRQGYIDRVNVSITVDNADGTNEVEVTFEDKIIVKNNCEKAIEPATISTW